MFQDVPGIVHPTASTASASKSAHAAVQCRSLSIRPKAASDGADLTRCEGKAEVAEMPEMAESECTNGTCHHLTAPRNLTFTSFMPVFTLVLYAHLCPTC